MDDHTWLDLVDPDPEDLVAAIPVDVFESALDRLQAPARTATSPARGWRRTATTSSACSSSPAFLRNQGRVVYQEVDLVATRERLVTVRKRPAEGEPFDFEAVRKTAVAARCSPGMCLYALVDEVAERYLTLVDDFHVRRRRAGGQDRGVAGGQAAGEDLPASPRDPARAPGRHPPVTSPARCSTTGSSSRAKPSCSRGRSRFTSPTPTTSSCGPPTVWTFSRDLLAGVRDHHQAQVANDQNKVMKRLTVVASLLLVPTFIVGVYGKNFERIPEHSIGFGYAWSWGLIIVATVAQLVYFRRKRWM